MNFLFFDLTDLSSEFYSMIRGALLLLSVYHIIIYYLYRNSTYLHYSVYSFLLYLFLLKQIATGFLAELNSYIDRSIQLCVFCAYLMFTREIIQTKELIPIWDKSIKILVYILMVLAFLLGFITLIFNEQTKFIIFYFIFIVYSIFSILLSIRLIKEKKHHVKLFLFGSIFFLLMIFININIKYLEIDYLFINKGIHPLFFLYLGAIVEFIVFAFLISFRYRELLEEQKQLELALSKYKIEASELKLMTLKSQLNPQFLYNTLNSINNFVLKNEVETASDYITKFARFIRNILQVSNQTTITLSEELANLKTYINLEKIRTNNNFEFIENIEIGLSINSSKVPPLFLQPFIENSIWHGFPLKNGKKFILLNISTTANFINFEIIDNGIGINKAKELNTLNVYKTKGNATDSAIFRIKKVFNAKNINIDRSDISNNKTSGTKVLISFPKMS